MFDTSLITEVKNHSILWHPERAVSKSAKHALVTEWIKVASVLKVQPKHLKFKWDFLCKIYKSEINRLIASGELKAGDESVPIGRSTWPFFDRMHFIYEPTRPMSNHNARRVHTALQNRLAKNLLTPNAQSYDYIGKDRNATDDRKAAGQ